MLKNQHLLGGLVVLGAINVLAFFGLISGERDSARAVNGLQHELSDSHENNKRSIESLTRQNEDLQRNLEQARTAIDKLQESLDSIRERQARMRDRLAIIEERLEKLAPASRSSGDKEQNQ